ncbi:MAG: type II/IV secretion system protein [Planctomycetes bacterium]|nr:type II/IV secretion system protein [Planctomycetota bacterium]
MSCVITTGATSPVAEKLRQISQADPLYASRFVDILLTNAAASGASDLHLQPEPGGIEIAWRLDGVLQQIGRFPRGQITDVVTRLKVLADLLTYRTDIPQEGRLRGDWSAIEMRVSTFPTLHGERAAVRMFSAANQLLYPEDLQLAPDDANAWLRHLRDDCGVLIVSGPAGSGKTTTAYASVRQLLRDAGGTRCVLSIEDPIEVPIPGVAQSEVNPAAGFDLALALRSALRQDPEVLLVGEIRDPSIAAGVFSAALTGHLVVTTFHAGSAAQALARLAEMAIEPYLLQSALRGILNQRLVRRLCRCARDLLDSTEYLGLPITRAKGPVGCQECQQTGYRGRAVISEFLPCEIPAVRSAIGSRPQADYLEQVAREVGMTPLSARGIQLVESGKTSPAELRRI